MANNELEPGVNIEEALAKTFGSKHRLPIWAAIGKYSIDPPENFYAHRIYMEYGEQRGIPENAIAKELRILEALGMVEREEARGYKKPYRRTESALWRVVEVAEEAFAQEFPEDQQ